MNGPRLPPDLSQLNGIADALSSRVHVAQTARREPDSGLVASLKEAEGADPERDDARQPPESGCIEQQERRGENTRSHRRENAEPEPLLLAPRADVRDQLYSGAGGGAGPPNRARLSNRDAHHVSEPPITPRSRPTMSAPMIMAVFTNCGDRIKRSLAESVRAAWGNIFVYHAGSFVCRVWDSVTALLS